jgi:hypothetical protein
MRITLTTKDGASTLNGTLVRELLVGWWIRVDGETNFGERFFRKDDWTALTVPRANEATNHDVITQWGEYL